MPAGIRPERPAHRRIRDHEADDNVRNEMQGVSREDIDTIMLTVRHMEKRLLDQVEELATQVKEMKERMGNGEGKRPVAEAPSPTPRPAKTSRKPSRGNGKVKTL
jgi:hypothetical protein